MPKVSIIVPAYNAEKTIGRCVESILNQTYTDFELIVMDDGSRDSTAQILDDYAAKDGRMKVVHKENSGVSDTRNQGLDLATGEYLQFLDADDWCPPDATRLFVRAIEDNEGCDLVIADFYRVIDDKMAVKGDIPEEKMFTREEYADIMMKNPADFYYGVLWNKLYRRSIVEEFEMRMDVNLDWSEDFIFNMEYVLHAEGIYALKAPVYYYVKTEGSLVAQGGASPINTIKMKLSVIEYYRSFYKDIYNPGKYYLRSPSIYSFMLNFASDGGVNPFAPDKKLGEDRIDVRIAPEMEDSSFAMNFYEDRMLESSLVRFMSGNDLEENDAQVLIYMKLAGGTAILQEIRNYTGLSDRALAASIQKLTRRGILERVKIEKPRRGLISLLGGETAAGADPVAGAGMMAAEDADEIPEDPEENAEEISAADGGPDAEASRSVLPLRGRRRRDTAEEKKDDKKEKAREKVPVIYTFGEKAQPVLDALDRLFRDVEELQLSGFTEEEVETYRRLRGRAARNVHRALSEAAVTGVSILPDSAALPHIEQKD